MQTTSIRIMNHRVMSTSGKGLKTTPLVWLVDLHMMHRKPLPFVQRIRSQPTLQVKSLGLDVIKLKYKLQWFNERSGRWRPKKHALKGEQITVWSLFTSSVNKAAHTTSFYCYWDFFHGITHISQKQHLLLLLWQRARSFLQLVKKANVQNCHFY